MNHAQRLRMARCALRIAEEFQPATPFEKLMKATNVDQIRREIASLERRLAHPAGQG